MVKLGLQLPIWASIADTAAIAHVAESAEDLGLDTLWTFERLLSPTGDISMLGEQKPMPPEYNTTYTPLEVLSYVAARTSRIRLGTSILLALFHNPADMARRLATVDQLSGGRLDVGLGQGWLKEEFEAAGVPLSRRGSGFTEWIQAVRAAWRPDPVSFDGRFYRFAHSHISPKPVQPGGPPLMVAVSAPKAVDRMAKAGFGINPLWLGWDHFEGVVDHFRSAAREAGHDPDDLPIVARVNGSLTQDDQGDGPTLLGSADQARAALPRLEKLGVTEVFWGMDTPVDDQLERMERVARR